ncbi:MAG: hypothetical protein GXO75_16925 [Calditrichaeota bacterium]|nr:hypothetical protein [Calditrichota bacterium]
MKKNDPIKAYDARWEVNEFTESEIKRLFEASLIYGQALGVDTVYFSRDARLGCASVINWGVDVAVKCGFNVYICTDPISTPQSYFTTAKISQTHPGTMGFAVTASHNPSNYIGVKITVPGVRAIGLNAGPQGGFARIRNIYHSKQKLRTTKEKGNLHLVDFRDEYITYSIQAAGISPDDLLGIKVVLDGMNGSAGPEVYEAFYRMGIKIEPLNLIPDGLFPSGSPNPTSIGKMNDNIKLAKKINADAIIGLDGDGDRIVFGTGRGLLSAGFAMVQILHTVDGRDRAWEVKILADPKINPVALSEWKRLGATPRLFRNGHSQIKEYMRKIGAHLAAEESGHFYHLMKMDSLSYFAENNILTTLLFLKVLKENKEILNNIINLQASIHSTGEMNYKFPDDDTRNRGLDAIIKCFTDLRAETISHTKDGIDLEGILVLYGINIDTFAIKDPDRWFSGYFRIATNEKSVARFYITTQSASDCESYEAIIRETLETEYDGIVVD